jgi:hypothetical protein
VLRIEVRHRKQPVHAGDTRSASPDEVQTESCVQSQLGMDCCRHSLHWRIAAMIRRAVVLYDPARPHTDAITLLRKTKVIEAEAMAKQVQEGETDHAHLDANVTVIAAAFFPQACAQAQSTKNAVMQLDA